MLRSPPSPISFSDAHQYFLSLSVQLMITTAGPGMKTSPDEQSNDNLGLVK